MGKWRNLIIVFFVFSLGACSGFKDHSEIEALNEVQAVGSPFTQNLASEYRAFANREMNEMLDYPDALHFARKGLAAAAGEVVLPEPISDWNLLPRHMEELGTARGRLIVSFDLGAREIAPLQSAVAQAQFDCWIEQQEENWQEDDILKCKNGYLEAISALENRLMSVSAPIDPVPVVEALAASPEALPEQAELMTPDDAMYLLFFDFDSSAVGAGGSNVLDAVAQAVQSRNLNIVKISGHTDSAGSKSYNSKLAMRRANIVRDIITDLGVDPSIIKVEGRGEDELLVQTKDGTREPANRRVQITFE